LWKYAKAIPGCSTRGSGAGHPRCRSCSLNTAGTRNYPHSSGISFILSLVSWLVFPIIIGFVAIVLGVFSIYRAKKNQSKIPVSAILAIIIGLLAIVINIFWLNIFPAPAVFPPLTY
jgi:hypothetical protein